MTCYYDPDARRKKLNECANQIKLLLKKIGTNVEKMKETGNRWYPGIDLKTAGDAALLEIRALCPLGMFEFHFYQLPFWSLKLTYNEDADFVEYLGKGEGEIKEYGWYDRSFLMLDAGIRGLYMPIFEYLENISIKKECDLANLIEFLIPKGEELEKKIVVLYNKTKSILEQDEELRKVPIIERLLKDYEGKIAPLGLYSWLSRWRIDGWILWINNSLKFISDSKFDIYKGKIIVQEVPRFDFSPGKIIKVPLYIYEEIEEIRFPFEAKTIEEPVKEEIRDITLEDFKSQMEKLTKFNITYSEEILEKFYAGINSGNKFVIFSGATGTGKTLLSIFFPAVKHNILEKVINECEDENSLKERIQEELKDYICLVRVAPNWTSPKDVIGYFNPLNDQFVKGPLYDFLSRANDKKERDFFLILDEMNLSHPEHYLSDILSAMETKGEIDIHNSDEIETKYGIKKKITFPSNLHIIGTINIDETTKELSPRLKSRAFTVELRADFDNFIENCTNEDEIEVAEILKIIDEHLSNIELGVGYRDVKHISEYVKEGGNIDDALIQKIIPRIRTTDEKFGEVIQSLIEKLKGNFNKQTENFCKKLEQLEEKFSLQGFV